MLYLIGLGLYDESELSLKAVEIAKKCERFVELYTSDWRGDLEKVVGSVKKLERSDMEENSQKLLDLAKERDVAIFVPGDPLAATTHIGLLIDAKKQDIPYKIIHNSSIFSALGECGLELYKYGRVATVHSAENLELVKNTLEINKKAGLHTLLLLDIGLKAEEGVKILGDLIPEKVIAARFGEKTQIVYNKKENIKMESPCVLIISGKLHFKEEEFLNTF